MTINADLNLAEIPYETGEVQYRYARVLSEDRSRWIRHGLFCEYHRNGHVLSEGNYVNGKEHGLWRDYHDNGQLAAEGHYDNGVEVGEWKYWDAEGNPSDQ